MDQHHDVAPQRPADQHDTIVLAVPPEPAPADHPGTAAYPDRHASTSGQPHAGPRATGWQAVADWRGAIPPQAPTAWSQVPPFIPAAAPPVVVMRNNAAVVGATLGSVSLFLSLIPLIGIVAWLLAPVALITSAAGLIVGMVRKVGRVGAVWGVLTSSLALLVCVAWTALVLAL